MTFSLTRSRAAFAALLLATAGATSARAADDETPVSVLIGDAVAEYDAGHYQEARALFRQAHEKSPTARTLRGIGMCSFELRDYVEAARALGGALRDQRRPLTAEQKRHAEALLARTHTFIGRFTLKIKPEGSSVFVDGRPAEIEPDGVLLLPFGRHQLSVRCSSCAPAEKNVDVDVAGGEHKQIELALAPAPAPTTAGPTDTSTITTGTPAGSGATSSGGASTQPGGGSDTTEGSSAHLWFTGAAVAAALGAGGSALWWHDQQHQLDICHQAMNAGNMCTGQSTVEDRRKIAIGLTIGLGAAAVASGVVAGLLWPHGEHGGDHATSTAVACVPTTNTVSCAFRF